MSAPVDRLPFSARMRALAEHALSLSKAEYRSVHRELDVGDSYHRHLALKRSLRRELAEALLPRVFERRGSPAGRSG